MSAPRAGKVYGVRLGSVRVTQRLQNEQATQMKPGGRMWKIILIVHFMIDVKRLHFVIRDLSYKRDTHLDLHRRWSNTFDVFPPLAATLFVFGWILIQYR